MDLLAARDPERVAVHEVARGRAVTRREVADGSAALAAVWAPEVAHDDVVALALGNTADLVLACVAVWRLGATPLPLDPAAGHSAVLAAAAPALVVGTLPDGPGGRVPDRAPAPSWKATASGGSTGLHRDHHDPRRRVADGAGHGGPAGGRVLVPGGDARGPRAAARGGRRGDHDAARWSAVPPPRPIPRRSSRSRGRACRWWRCRRASRSSRDHCATTPGRCGVPCGGRRGRRRVSGGDGSGYPGRGPGARRRARGGSRGAVRPAPGRRPPSPARRRRTRAGGPARWERARRRR